MISKMARLGAALSTSTFYNIACQSIIACGHLGRYLNEFWTILSIFEVFFISASECIEHDRRCEAAWLLAAGVFDFKSAVKTQKVVNYSTKLLHFHKISPSG